MTTEGEARPQSRHHAITTCTPAQRERSAATQRALAADSMRPAPDPLRGSQRSARRAEASQRRVARTAGTNRNSTRAAWAANSSGTLRGKRARQRELLRSRGNAAGLLWGSASAGDETVRRAAVGLSFG